MLSTDETSGLECRAAKALCNQRSADGVDVGDEHREVGGGTDAEETGEEEEGTDAGEALERNARDQAKQASLRAGALVVP